MGKLLITGDLHLHHFKSYNLFNDPNFRLNQFIKVAHRIVDIANQENAKSLIIAGDFFHVASPRPYIVNTAFDFLDIITKRLDVFLTHGQHDADQRSTVKEKNTLLTLCNRVPRVRYLHKESVKIEEREFYFLGWEPNWGEYVKSIPQTDVLIGHVSPDNVKIGQYMQKFMGGIELPEKVPYKIAFLADIHYHQHYKNWVIPGTPIQHSFSDKPSVGIISLDTETLEWNHIPTIVPGSWDFLQMIISDKPSDDKYVITRRKTTTVTKSLKSTIEGSLKTLQVIQEEVKKVGLQDLHEQILGSVPKNVCEEVLLDFTIDRIQIKNFRSIADYKWDNVGNGVNLLVGLNGAGKTALVSAIVFGLAGEGDARKSTRIGTKSMEVIIDVTYGGLRHTLRRGWGGGGKTQYWINGEAQDAENQKGLKEKIEENLPFLQMMDLMYHRQDRPGFLASYNYAARVELISRVLGLKIVNKLHGAAQAQAIEIEQKLSTLRERFASVTAIIEQESLVDFSVMEMIDDATEDNLQTLRRKIQETLSSERHTYQQALAEKAAVTDRLKRATADVSKAKRKRERLGEFSCYTCGQALDAEKHKTLLNQINKEIEIRRQEVAAVQNDMSALIEHSTDECSILINQLEKRLSAVQTHLGEITAKKEQTKSLRKLRIAIDEAKEKSDKLQREISVVQEQRNALMTYRKLMEASGSVMRTLLTEVSNVLTTNTIRVRTYKTLVSGELRPDFGVDMDIRGRWISYDELSGGQKTVCDLAILENLIRVAGGVGLLIFDETFHDLDSSNLELAVNLIESLQCDTTFIISHTEGFPFYDTQIHSTMDEEGITTYVTR